MSSCVIEDVSQTQFDLQSLSLAMLSDDEYFVTTPMIAVHTNLPEARAVEEMYTSFEEALSGRAQAVSLQLHRLSGPLSTTPHIPSTPTTDALMLQQALATEPLKVLPLTQHWQNWQRRIVLTCLCSSLLLIGFDFMGLLLLTKH